MHAVSFRAVIFDLDGTLLDTLEDIAAGTNHVLAAAGFPTHPVAAYRRFVGNGVEMLLRRALPPEVTAALPPAAACAGPDAEANGGSGGRPGSPACSDRSETGGTADSALLPRLLDMLADYHREHEGVFTRPFPEIPDLLAGLRARGVALGVFSNKPQERTERAIAEFFPDTPFFGVRGARPGVPLKPDASGVLALAGEGGFAPDDVAYLGDSDVDMRTAINAGMYAAGAGWGFRGEEELRLAGAAEVFRRPLALLRLF